MANKRSTRKKKFTIRFELGVGGLVGLAIICFCIFLWMFLLGVWSGQTVLLPSDKGDTTKALSRLSSKLWSQGQEAASRRKKEFDNRSAIIQKGKSQVAEDEEPSFFTLQVAAYDNDDDARQEVLSWQARGEDSFFLKPEEGDSLFRVFLGRYDTLATANEKVDQLEEAENLQAFITLLPDSGNN